MTILVTGATGLVGGHLLWHLLQRNDKIIALKRSSSNLSALRAIFSFYSDKPELFLQRIKWRTADINDKDALRESLDKIEIVYHCAAIVSLGKGNPTLMDTNVVGTRNMVELALNLNVKKFCFVSSIAACGFDTNKTYIDEQIQWSTNEHKSMYALSKYNAEQEVWKGTQKGLNAVIINPGVILGVSGSPSGSSLIFSQVRKGLFFYTLGGSGYVDVRDVVRAMILLTNSNIVAERYILVGENRSNKEIITMMADGFGKLRPFINVSKSLLLVIGRIAETLGKIFCFNPIIDRDFAISATNRSYYSSEKIIKELDFTFTPITECIDEVCKYMIQSKK